MLKNSFIISFIFMCLFCSNVYAQNNTFEKLDNLDTKILILEKKLKIKELEKKISGEDNVKKSTQQNDFMQFNNAQSNMGNSQPTSGNSENNLSASEIKELVEQTQEKEKQKEKKEVVLPKVNNIIGFGDKLRAEVVFPDKTIKVLSKGDSLKSYKVVNITNKGVNIKNKNGEKMLRFSESINSDIGYSQINSPQGENYTENELTPNDSTTIN